MNKIIRADGDILSDIFIANNIKSRFLGYMFQKKPQYDSIMFKPCNSIHTFFMKFNIDLLFLNDNMEIVKIIENLTPGKIIMPVKCAKIVIEAKAGNLKKLRIGDKIILV